MPKQRILRKEGTRYEPENIKERGSQGIVKIHVSGWANWFRKCERLCIYNDEK